MLSDEVLMLQRHRWILDLRYFDLTKLLEDFVEQHPGGQQLTVKDFEKRLRDAAAKNLPAAALYTGLCQLQSNTLWLLSASCLANSELVQAPCFMV
jgi:hypothetical protein